MKPHVDDRLDQPTEHELAGGADDTRPCPVWEPPTTPQLLVDFDGFGWEEDGGRRA